MRTGLLVALIAAPLGLLVAGAWLSVHLGLRRRLRAVRRLAAELGGIVRTAGPNAILEWERRGLQHRLRVRSRRVDLRVAVPRSILAWVRVGPREGAQTLHWLDRDRNPFRHLEVGHEEGFDPARFLTERVRKNVGLIDLLDFSRGVQVEIRSGEVVVSKRSPLSVETSLRFFVNLALPIVDHALSACVVGGMEIFDEGSPADGACPVCGFSLERGRVRCSKCGTPHHLDCWRYVGKCSTYACGERVARP
jgi:hypothetical protein